MVTYQLAGAPTTVCRLPVLNRSTPRLQISRARFRHLSPPSPRPRRFPLAFWVSSINYKGVHQFDTLTYCPRRCCAKPRRHVRAKNVPVCQWLNAFSKMNEKLIVYRWPWLRRLGIFPPPSMFDFFSRARRLENDGGFRPRIGIRFRVFVIIAIN